jgi:RNA polymerase sigma factor (sigma-70 family)
VLGGIGDVAELYAASAGRVAQQVRHGIRAPEPVIEDACQVAWSRLIHHRGRVRRETAIAWVVKTAIHEALKLIRREHRELSLDALLEQAAEKTPTGTTPSLQELVELRARLDSIRLLPERQQRLVWLQGLGLSYTEMASQTGATTRTVERQLLRAKHKLTQTDA